jgi:hypothetical protein
MLFGMTLETTALMRPAAAPDRELAGRVLPLYVGSLVVTVAGIAAVAVTLSDATAWAGRCVGLATLGHAVSFYMRQGRVPPKVGYLPALGLLGIGLVRASANGLSDLGSGSGPLTRDLTLAVLISWLTVIRSFALVSNGALVFSSDPALATIGLSASVNPNSEIRALFGILLFATLFTAIYEQSTGRAHASRERGRMLAWHVTTAGLVFAGVVACGSVIGMVVRRVFSPLTAYALPAISHIQAAATSFVNSPQGVNSRVSVGGGPIILPPTPVFDVYMPEPGLLRTGVFEEYDGRAWAPLRAGAPRLVSRRTVQPHPVSEIHEAVSWDRPLFVYPLEPSPDLAYPVKTHRVRQTIVARAPLGDRPVLDRPVEVHLPESRAAFEPRDGVVSGSRFLNRGSVMEVVSEVPMIPPAALEAAHPCAEARGKVSAACFRVPFTAGRILGLAQHVTAGQTNDYDRVQAVLAYIERTCSYSLIEDPTPEGEDAVEHYLFTSRVGACGLATSAAILMCRSIGIPARAVHGYRADQPLESGGYLVRQMDAHMWLEVYFPGYGWVTFDPSPPERQAQPTRTPWLGHEFHQFVLSLSREGIDLYLLVIVVVLALAVLCPAAIGSARRRWMRWQRERELLRAGGPEAFAIIYQRMTGQLASAGWGFDPSMTPGEYQRWISEAWGRSEPATGCVERITERLVRTCYAGDQDAVGRSEALRDCALLRRTAPRRQLR